MKRVHLLNIFLFVLIEEASLNGSAFVCRWLQRFSGSIWPSGCHSARPCGCLGGVEEDTSWFAEEAKLHRRWTTVSITKGKCRRPTHGSDARACMNLHYVHRTRLKNRVEATTRAGSREALTSNPDRGNMHPA